MTVEQVPPAARGGDSIRRSLFVLLVLSIAWAGPLSGTPLCLSTITLTLGPGSIVTIEIDGTTSACVGSGSGLYSEIQVTGDIFLGGATLDVVLGYTPSLGDTYTIIATTG